MDDEPVGRERLSLQRAEREHRERVRNRRETRRPRPSYFVAALPQLTWTLGDRYAIVRASRCLDQASSYGGSRLSGKTATLPTAPEVINPSYEFNDIAGSRGTPTNAVCSSNTQNLWPTGTSTARSAGQAAQTSRLVRFNGTSGVGHGTLANLPTTCTSRVGYWATDQGNWNQSGSGGQGQLYVCTATDTWSLTTRRTHIRTRLLPAALPEV